jgi:hypothetical protein
VSQEIAELQHSQEFTKEVDAAEMRETLVITGKPQISW